MAPDVPADNQMLGYDGAEDHDGDERGDSTKRASRLEKGKLVKQSAGIQPDEEPVTHKHFEDLAHAILRAVGSRVPEAATSHPFLFVAGLENELLHMKEGDVFEMTDITSPNANSFQNE